MTDGIDGATEAGLWRGIGRVATAHVVGLREAAVVDDPVVAALLTAMDGVRRGTAPAGVGLTELIGRFDERLDAVTPGVVVGVGSVGRARADVAAAVARLELRNGLIGLAAATAGARSALLELAGQHAFTLMPAYAGARAVQPTTFAHFLGGALAPLGRATGGVREVYAEVNRSPLGAGALASTALPIDRERTAALLGFDGAVASSFDAVAAIDHLPRVVSAASAVAAVVGRLGAELLIWIRSEPDCFRLPEGWTGEAEPDLPQFRPPIGVERLVIDARRRIGEAAAVAGLAWEAPYGPAGATLDAAIGSALGVLAGVGELAGRLGDLARGLEVNRALLASRAGRDHTTSGDLAEMLIADEGLEPAAARAIVALTVRRAMEQGMEAGGITPEAIDAAALLVIGRELGVEIERIGRTVAPRRFLERRAMAGGPAPAPTRIYLDGERARLVDDERWRTEAEDRLGKAAAGLERAEAEILEAVG